MLVATNSNNSNFGDEELGSILQFIGEGESCHVHIGPHQITLANGGDDNPFGGDCFRIACLVMKIALTIIALGVLILAWPTTIFLVTYITCLSFYSSHNFFAAAFNLWSVWMRSQGICCDNNLMAEQYVSQRAPNIENIFNTFRGENSFRSAPVVINDTYLIPVNEDVAIGTSDQEARRVAFTNFFNNTQGSVEINPLKAIPLEAMFAPYTNPRIDNVYTHWQNWDNHDFATQDRDLQGLKERLLPYLEEAHNGQRGHGREGASRRKVCQYINILFNVLGRYKQSLQTLPENEREASMVIYKDHFLTTINKVYDTFHSGCPFNQLSNLPKILAETVALHPSMIPEGTAPIDFLFALLLFRYQRQEIIQSIQRNNRTGDQVEMEWALLQRLGIVQESFTTHIFDASDDRLDPVERDFLRDCKPLQFLMTQLTEPTDAARLTAAFHTTIQQWYMEQGFDFDESQADRNLLLNIEQSTEYVPCFNEKAILYFLMSNQLIKLI